MYVYMYIHKEFYHVLLDRVCRRRTTLTLSPERSRTRQLSSAQPSGTQCVHVLCSALELGGGGGGGGQGRGELRIVVEGGS